MRDFVWFLRSEIRLIAGRRRNQAGLLVLMSLPVLIAVATKLTSSGAEFGSAGAIDQITNNGVFVAFAALTVEMSLFLPVGMAMVSGDAIAGEASHGTLRYLLTVPVGRTRLLIVKYVALVLTGLVGASAVAATGVVIGGALFGFGPLTTLSGSQISLAEGLGRLAITVLYITAGLAALAAFGLFVSTMTEQPIAATIVVVIFTAGSWILEAIPQVEVIHPWLLVHRWTAFTDVMRDPPLWDAMIEGLGVNAAYAVVFLLAAWARFLGKDVTS